MVIDEGKKLQMQQKKTEKIKLKFQKLVVQKRNVYSTQLAIVYKCASNQTLKYNYHFTAHIQFQNCSCSYETNFLSTIERGREKDGITVYFRTIESVKGTLYLYLFHRRQ